MDCTAAREHGKTNTPEEASADKERKPTENQSADSSKFKKSECVVDQPALNELERKRECLGG